MALARQVKVLATKSNDLVTGFHMVEGANQFLQVSSYIMVHVSRYAHTGEGEEWEKYNFKNQQKHVPTHLEVNG